MKLRKWLSLRSPAYVRRRIGILLDRYGVTPAKATARIDRCVATLAGCGCAPTFPTPGSTVDRYSRFIRQVQDAGAEIAVHGYNHVDMKAYPPEEAGRQLVRAAQAFERHRIEVHGFRCPYLSFTDELLGALPSGLFRYSSNKALWWDVAPPAADDRLATVFHTLRAFYRPAPATGAVSVPWTQDGTVEIPVSVPDDLQLHDGLHLGPEGIARGWGEMLSRTHRRGELLTIMFHPELATVCEQPFIDVLSRARSLQPGVWVARLSEIGDWWREKAAFYARVEPGPAGPQVAFTSSERATILARGLPTGDGDGRWDGPYTRLTGAPLTLPDERLPFLGLPEGAPEATVAFLREQGYIVVTGEEAARCHTRVDAERLAAMPTQVELVEHIESLPTPLVRYWRWPAGARSALSVTGDLDAITLLDFGFRLFAR